VTGAADPSSAGIVFVLALVGSGTVAVFCLVLIVWSLMHLAEEVVAWIAKR
jgi:hypothetical protein